MPAVVSASPIGTARPTHTAPAELLRRLGVGDAFVAWAAGAPDLEAAYFACPRGDWLMELALAVHIERRRAVAAALECAERARRMALPANRHVLLALETTRRWLAGEAQGATCCSAAFAASEAASELPDGSPERHAALAAVSVAHGCDAEASPVYYAQRAHPVRAVAHAIEAQPTAGAAAACADVVRAHLPLSLVRSTLPEALRRSEPPAPPHPSTTEVEGTWYAHPTEACGTPPRD